MFQLIILYQFCPFTTYYLFNLFLLIPPSLWPLSLSALLFSCVTLGYPFFSLALLYEPKPRLLCALRDYGHTFKVLVSQLPVP